MTISGVKKILNENSTLKLDVLRNNSINIDNSKIKNKLKNILSLIKELKKIK